MKTQIITKRKKRIAIIFLCLIFIFQAFPIVGCTSDNTDAGAGGETTEEMLEDIVTDENGIPYTYPMFVEDLEPLTGEEMLKIDELWVKKEYDYEYNSEYNRHLLNGRDESYAKDKATIQAKIGAEKAHHRFFNEIYFGRYRYYGKFNDCIVLVLVGISDVVTEYSIAGYTLSFSSSATVFAIKSETIYDLYEAYNLGYLNESNIAILADRNLAYDIFYEEWRNENNRIIKEKN